MGVVESGPSEPILDVGVHRRRSQTRFSGSVNELPRLEARQAQRAKGIDDSVKTVSCYLLARK